MRKPKSDTSLLFLLKILITAIAYYYIYYRITTSLNEDHNIYFNLFTFEKSLFIFFALLLVVPNWLLESVKWKTLLSTVQKTSFQKAVKSVLIGITCSIFTPYRIGEYFGRPIVLQKEKRPQGILALMMGSISQNIVTYSLGIVGTILLLTTPTETTRSFNYQIITIVVLLIIILLFLLFYFNPSILTIFFNRINFFKRNRQKLEFITKYTKKELLYILLIGFARYFIFFSQYYLLLLSFDIQIYIIEAFTAISLSYVFLFTIPGIPIADVGIRGSLALFFLGMYSSNEIGIVTASSLIWVINLAIPAIVGSVLLMRYKKNSK